MPLWLVVMLVLMGGAVSPAVVETVAGDAITPVGVYTPLGFVRIPGNPLYALERVGEVQVEMLLNATRMVSPDWAGNAVFGYRLKLCEERLKELQACLAVNDSTACEYCCREYSRELNRTCRMAYGLNKTELLYLVSNMTQRHRQVLEQVKELIEASPMPEHAKEKALAAVTKAIEESEKGYQECTKAIEKHHSGMLGG